MARIARVILPNQPCLVLHRGHEGQHVFFSEDDYSFYLAMLKSYAEEYGVSIYGYCLLPDRVLIVASGKKRESLAAAMSRTHMRYARWINSEHGWGGHLWGNRFQSSLLEEKCLADAVRYVEQAAVRARLAKKPLEYKWSSAKGNCKKAKDQVLAPVRPFLAKVDSWAKALAKDVDPAVAKAFQANVSTGRPTGSDNFVQKLERKLGRVLRPRKRGPKPASKG